MWDIKSLTDLQAKIARHEGPFWIMATATMGQMVAGYLQALLKLEELRRENTSRQEEMLDQAERQRDADRGNW